MVLKRPVHIARKGRIIGEFSSSELPILLECGEILEDDTCYIEETNEWQAVRDYIQATATPKARLALEYDEAPLEPTKGPSVLLGSRGLIALAVLLLFFLALLAAAGAWVYSLQSQLESTKVQLANLQNELLLRSKAPSSGESAPQIPTERTKVVGAVEIRNEEGEKRPLPGFYVDLYEEKKIQEYLLSRSLDLAAYKQSWDADIIGRILRDMPAPLRKTTTDSAGHYEFQLPEEGRYVVYSSMTIESPSGPEILLWFLSFATDDPLNLPVNITDENRAKRLEPEFLIRLGRPDSSAPPR
jgi:hypothetical protein